jgi:transketolase
VFGIATFGESAPGGDVMKHFGFTVEGVVAQARRLLA